MARFSGDEFCVEHGREKMRCDGGWGGIPWCALCNPVREEQRIDDAYQNILRRAINRKRRGVCT